MRDANRARPDDLLPGLREAFERLDAAEAEAAGRRWPASTPCDRSPSATCRCSASRSTDARLGPSSATRCDKAGALGIDEYERVRDDLIERVIEAKLRRLATLDPATCTVAEWSSATHLDVMSMHDTMNHTARPDGAICLERQPEDRLPAVVALSNHGDASGELAASDDRDAARRRPGCRRCDPIGCGPSAAPTRWRSTPWGPDDVAFNRPYMGGHETRTIGPKTAEPSNRSPWCARRGGVTRRLHFGVWQNEFLREFLLGPEAAAAPGAARHRLGVARPTTASTGSPADYDTPTTSSAAGATHSPGEHRLCGDFDR